MKDKLEKIGHKRAYYRLRFALWSFLVLLGILSLSAIPVGITYSVAMGAEAKKQENTSSVVETTEKGDKVMEGPSLRLAL